MTKIMFDLQVSDMILTSLTVSGDYAWTAGWDGVVRRWKIAQDILEPAGELNLGSCINGLASNIECTYAILSGGKIVKIKAI